VSTSAWTPAPDGASCDDENPCTETDTCQAGVCTGSNPKWCAELDQCHVPGVCNPATGGCSYEDEADGTECDDGNPCTQTDTCQAGACTGVAVACPPPDQCHNAGTCDSSGSCTYTAKADGTSCSDGNVCTQGDSCQAGACVGTAAPAGTSCADSNPCNGVETCDGAGACVGTVAAAGTPCSDGNLCNGVETCDGAGACVAAMLPRVDDGKPCTVDTCDPVTGTITSVPAATGSPCSTGDWCLGAGTCDAQHACVLSPVAIDDHDPKTLDTCDPGTGVVDHVTCPDLDTKLAATLDKAASWHCAGTGPLQPGLDATKLDPTRVAVIHGKVSNDAGGLVGATISVAGHPEYGHTLSQLTGFYDLTVNGGGSLTLVIERVGYLTMRRQVAVPVQDYVIAPEATMTKPDVPTVIVLGPDSDGAVVRGSPVAYHETQTRRATLIFQPSTTARVGTTDLSDPLSVRATEYTVASDELRRMPADLPPTSGYTYAVSYQIDGVKEGTRVNFDPPVFAYVENFTTPKMPVGGHVPAAYFDKDANAWVPSADGQAIRIVGRTNGLADVDSDGPDEYGEYAADALLGMDDYEREQLALIYPDGADLWRVPITHFSDWDFNWPITWPADAISPLEAIKGLLGNGNAANSCKVSASIIECENQILGEAIPVAGTPYSLTYWSNRTPGRRAAYELVVHPLPSTFPSSIESVEVRTVIAGQEIRESLDCYNGECTCTTPEECVKGVPVTLSWDGRDVFGRTVQGRVPVTVWIGYTYHAFYGIPNPGGFGLPGSGVVATGSLAEQQLTLWSAWNTALGTWLAAEEKLGGFSFDVQHRYDPVEKAVYFGYGGEQAAESLGQIISRYAGGGQDSGNPVPATSADLSGVWSVAVAPDGSVYFAETNKHRIRKVSPQGVISTVAGTGSAGDDVGPQSRLVAKFTSPRGIAVGPDGNLYVADTGNNKVRMIDMSSGLVTTVAGNGDQSVICGEGLSATSASLWQPLGVAVAPDGTIFIADSAFDRVRTVAPARAGLDRKIYTLAGKSVCSVPGFCPNSPTGVGDGGPAVCATLHGPHGLALGRDGSVNIAEESGHRIRKVGSDGVIQTIAGNGAAQDSPEGAVATISHVNNPAGLALGADGSVYIADTGNNRIKRITTGGTLHTVAGSGSAGTSGDGGPATSAKLNMPRGVAVAPDGTLYIADGDRIRRVSTALPGYTAAGDIVIASRDGAMVYTFDPSGRHKNTKDALSGATLVSFAYDGGGLLHTIADSAGNETTITRDATTGKPTRITGPYGHITLLETYDDLEGKGYLHKVTNPEGEVVNLEYWPLGLLKKLIDPKLQEHDFYFDALGRLSTDVNPAGGQKSLVRDELKRSYWVDVTTKHSSTVDLTTTHKVELLDDKTERRTVTGPDDVATVSLLRPDGSREITYADGTKVTATTAGDPRFGMQAPVFKQIDLWSAGKEMTINKTLTTTPAVPSSAFDVTQIVETTSVKVGVQLTRTYDMVAGKLTKLTEKSPLQRTQTTWFDDQGRISETQVSGLPMVHVDYNAHGRVWKVTHKHPTNPALNRTWEIAYRTDGEIDWTKDPDGVQTAHFAYDLVGRPTTVTQPGVGGSRVTGYTYDENGNLSTLTPPGKTAHTFLVRGDDLVTKYTPPDLGFTRKSTDFTSFFDGSPDTTTIPHGTTAGTLSVGYDPQGRVEHVDTAGGNADFNLTLHYAPSTDATEPGKLKSIDGPVTGSSMSFTSAGVFPTQTVTTDAVSGLSATVNRTFDNQFRLYSEEMAGGPTVTFDYDDDGLLKTAGALTINRNANNGLLHDTELKVGNSSVTDLYAFATTGFGELNSYTAKRGATVLFSANYANGYDKRGRLTSKSETIVDQAGTYEYDEYGYEYDAAGRLKRYTKKNSPPVDYTYDANGNRTGAGWSTDAQDRLSASPFASYTYTEDGARKTRTASGQTTTYTYDLAGNLRAVALPSPQAAITYGVDALGRRVSRKVGGGSDIRAWAWNGAHIIGENGSAGQRAFVYGVHGNVPDYMVDVTGGHTYRLIKDHLGSVRLVVDVVSGTIEQQIEYDPWGKVLSETGAGFQPFGFAGGLYDHDTGLVRFGARDYDPETGTWTTKDPSGVSGGSNLYGYALQDPVNYADMDGRMPVAVWAGAAAAGAIAGAEGELAKQLTDRVLNFDTCTPIQFGAVIGAAGMGAALGGVIPQAVKPLRIRSRNWKPVDITDPRCERGCEAVARDIQKLIGGDVVRITPKETRLLPEFRNHSWGWFHHEVVLRDGLVYDATTGGAGLSTSGYKALWQFPEEVSFGF
jgi:RHS repeat-associated protein